MSNKTIYLLRHFEAEHNVDRQFHIADPRLTALGRLQARHLSATLPEETREDVQLIVSSPLRRTLETTLLGLEPLLERLGPKNVVLLPHAQEVNSNPCDTGSPVDELRSDSTFKNLNFSSLSKIPDWISKQGFWSNDPACVHARAKYVRRWLRDRPEDKIVLVSHGNFLRYLISRAKTDDLFANGEIRSYTFKENDDEDASLVRLDTKAKVGEVEATSDFDAGGVAKG